MLTAVEKDDTKWAKVAPKEVGRNVILQSFVIFSQYFLLRDKPSW